MLSGAFARLAQTRFWTLTFACAVVLCAGAARVAAEPGPPPGRGERSTARLDVGDWFGRPPVERNPRTWQRRKNPTLAMVSSFLVPGLGQLYNERGFWALVAAGVHIYYVGDIIIESRLTNRYRRRADADPTDVDARVLYLLHRDNRTQSAWLLGLTVLLSGLQAFVDAHLFDFDDAPLRFEPELGRLQGGALRFHF